MRRDLRRRPEQSVAEGGVEGVAHRVRRSMLLGWKTGLVFCAWVIVLIVLNGSFTLQMHDGHTANAFAVFALYFFGGPVAGAIVGVLLPLMKPWPGALLVGYVAAIPAAVGCVFIVRGFVPWDTVSTIVAAGTALIGPVTVFFIRVGEKEIASGRSDSP